MKTSKEDKEFILGLRLEHRYYLVNRAHTTFAEFLTMLAVLVGAILLLLPENLRGYYFYGISYTNLISYVSLLVLIGLSIWTYKKYKRDLNYAKEAGKQVQKEFKKLYPKYHFTFH